MPKNNPDSKRSAEKNSLNAGAGGAVPGEPGGAPSKKTDRNQMQETRTAGQFTGRGKPALQKK